MKKSKLIIAILTIFSITLAITPAAIPQVGTYTFHGAPGHIKILEVKTANNASLQKIFGAGYVGILEGFFGTGCLVEGAMKKSLVTGVNMSYDLDMSFYVLGVMDGVEYNTSNWDWTTESFENTPDSVGDIVYSFYDPTNLTKYIDTWWVTWFAQNHNVSTHTGGAYLAQLPTPVDQYLGALVWEPKWENFANTIVHHAEENDFITGSAIQYLENCTETWTYDTTFGAWIGYKIEANATTIYEFDIFLAIPGIPGYELSMTLGVAMVGIIGIIFIIKKKKRI
jgi:hypothetical protein